MRPRGGVELLARGVQLLHFREGLLRGGRWRPGASSWQTGPLLRFRCLEAAPLLPTEQLAAWPRRRRLGLARRGPRRPRLLPRRVPARRQRRGRRRTPRAAPLGAPHPGRSCATRCSATPGSRRASTRLVCAPRGPLAARAARWTVRSRRTSGAAAAGSCCHCAAAARRPYQSGRHPSHRGSKRLAPVPSSAQHAGSLATGAGLSAAAGLHEARPGSARRRGPLQPPWAAGALPVQVLQPVHPAWTILPGA